ncbi:MAG TPA: hypothetical protein VEY91_10160 [Candidatus Limnocylindria bacterium]|nr:hypothetical protein [Candidatus Limnocylindria bacterium]
MIDPAPGRPLTVREVFSTWWPLAASWLLMALELPAVSAVMARMADPTLSLAAYGGVVFPLALLIEAPIVMLLTASTALCRDWDSYRRVQRFMLLTSGGLTVLHVLVAFTPLYDLLVGGWMGVPQPVLEPARWGLQIMTPWTFAIAYRRTQQGVLIRFGHSRAVGVGTTVRLAAIGAVLAIGYALGNVPGIVVGSAAVAAGVTSEAIYAAIVVQPVLRDQVRPAPAVAIPLTAGRFMRFYLPLMATPMIWFLSVPLTTGAMTRMPLAIASLAVWPVVNGLVFTMRSLGFSYSEVVVALLDRPRPLPALRRFALLLAAATSLVLLLVAATPLARVWFGQVSNLPPALAAMGVTALWIVVLLPALNVYQSLYQGAIVNSHRTRGITESVIVLLAVAGLVLMAGISYGRADGLVVGQIAMIASSVAQLGWLWFRARPALRDIAESATSAAA